MTSSPLEKRPSKAKMAKCQTRLSTECIISRQTFRGLPFDVQMDYAKYHNLPCSHNLKLTTEEICDSLFEHTKWTPVLQMEGHIRLATLESLFVAKDVMDLVDWLVDHHTDPTLSEIRLYTSGDVDGGGKMESGVSFEVVKSDVTCDPHVSGNSIPSSYDLHRKLNALWTEHTCIITAVETSRKAIRAACAELVDIQSRLAKELSYQHGVAEKIASIVGEDSMNRIQDHLDIVTWPLHSTLSQEKYHKARQITILSSFHTLHFEGIQSYPGSDVDPAPPKDRDSGATKRPFEDEYEPASNNHNVASRRHKRPRIEGRNPTIIRVQDISVPQTTLNYPSNDNQDDSEDSSASDSNGTEVVSTSWLALDVDERLDSILASYQSHFLRNGRIL